MDCARDEWHDCSPILCIDVGQLERSIAASPDPAPEDHRRVFVTGGTRDVEAAVFGIDTKRRAPLPPIPRSLMRDPMEEAEAEVEAVKQLDSPPVPARAARKFRVVEIAPGRWAVVEEC